VFYNNNKGINEYKIDLMPTTLLTYSTYVSSRIIEDLEILWLVSAVYPFLISLSKMFVARRIGVMTVLSS
jgi:hypothetical protein